MNTNDRVSSHPVPELRRSFPRLARAYVAAMDAYSRCIQDEQAAPCVATSTAKTLANKARRRAYEALMAAAVTLAEVEAGVRA